MLKKHTGVLSITPDEMPPYETRNSFKSLDFVKRVALIYFFLRQS